MTPFCAPGTPANASSILLAPGSFCASKDITAAPAPVALAYPIDAAAASSLDIPFFSKCLLISSKVCAPISAPCCAAPVPIAAAVPAAPAFLAAASLASPVRAFFPAIAPRLTARAAPKDGINCGAVSARKFVISAGLDTVLEKVVLNASHSPVFAASCTAVSLSTLAALS